MKYSTLKDPELDDIWNWFYNKFSFNPSHDEKNWPSIQPTTPSRTYHFDDYQLKDDFDSYEDWIQAGIINIEGNQAELYALDWQHECYKFRIDNYGCLPIGFYPYGDYYIFLSSSLEFGVFTHPWEQTVCIFGSKLVDVLTKQYAILFSKELRRS